MNPFTLLALAFVLVLVNGFFVAVEFALMTVRRPRIEELHDSNVAGARSVLRALDSINVQLAASQFGISVVSIVIGWLVEPVITHQIIRMLGGLDLSPNLVRVFGIAVGLGLVAFVHMVLGEMVPRSIALTSPEGTARILVPVHLGFVTVFRPVVRLLHWMGRVGTKLLRVEPIDELSSSHSASELAVMVDEAHASGQIEPSDRALLAGAFSFLDVTVGDVMTPAAELVTIPHTATIGEAERLLYESGHSRVLVMGAAADQVIGFLHAKDLIAMTDADRDSLLPSAVIRVAARSAPGERLGEVLLKMRRLRRHVAVVLEGTDMVGLITLEDVLESIVGDIRDESDLFEAATATPEASEPTAENWGIK